MDNKDVQTELKMLGFYKGELDGIYGSKSQKAVDEFLKALKIPGFMTWGKDRRFIAAKQAICEANKIEAGKIDGLVGPQTLHAIDVYDTRKREGVIGNSTAEVWRDSAEKEAPKTEPKNEKVAKWPTQARVAEVFGHVGSRQTRVIVPYPMYLAWDLKSRVSWIGCHELVKAPLERVLKAVLDHYGLEEIKKLHLDLFGGSLNVRKIRGGSGWSMHSWGIAFDFDPLRNTMKMHKPMAEFSKPEYNAWFDIWESEGAISLGRERDYDWMHTQFARLK